ncbi:MAG: acetate--CoA ligase family protein [Planctomycetes bacterium]|nr:acetate--CoA ligase family protein [Planctomycetota bacterium]
MDLMEYKAKEYFQHYGIPGPSGFVVADAAALAEREATFPCMVKAQVPIGGRGKAGGIRAAGNAAELDEACRTILGMTIGGHVVERVLVSEQVRFTEEWYLAVALDREAKCPVVIFSPVGGMDIEETARTHPERISRVRIDPVIGLRSSVTTYLVSRSGVDPQYAGQLGDILLRLYRLFREVDCTLAEINPLAVSDGGALLALDAKVTVDDAALFRHPDLAGLRDEMEPNPLVLDGRRHGFLYIPCEPGGRVAVVSNGSGMIMSCIDVLAATGLAVGAAIDLGGGPTADRVREATRVALAAPGVEALFINIFGGITRCDEVANGVKEYMESVGSDRLVVMRCEGTNKEEGLRILERLDRENVVFADGLHEGVAILAQRKGWS